jgi:hypothetical protein
MRTRDMAWKKFRIQDGKKSDPGSGINIAGNTALQCIFLPNLVDKVILGGSRELLLGDKLNRHRGSAARAGSRLENAPRGPASDFILDYVIADGNPA